MLSRYIGQMNVPQLRNKYQVAVGIPAEDFRLLIMKLCQFGVLGTRRTIQLHIPLLSSSSVMTAVPQLQYQYQVRVGIPVQQFEVIILTLSRFGATVSATVTDTQVQFFVRNGNGGMFTFPILKKPEQCSIEGDVGANPVSLVLDLRHASAILHASVMSKTVWLFCQSHGSSVMLNCPFDRLGNLYYYFPEA